MPAIRRRSVYPRRHFATLRAPRARHAAAAVRAAKGRGIPSEDVMHFSAHDFSETRGTMEGTGPLILGLRRAIDPDESVHLNPNVVKFALVKKDIENKDNIELLHSLNDLGIPTAYIDRNGRIDRISGGAGSAVEFTSDGGRLSVPSDIKEAFQFDPLATVKWTVTKPTMRQTRASPRGAGRGELTSLNGTIAVPDALSLDDQIALISARTGAPRDFVRKILTSSPATPVSASDGKDQWFGVPRATFFEETENGLLIPSAGLGRRQPPGAHFETISDSVLFLPPG